MNCGECDIDFACAKEGVSCIRLASPAAPAPGDMVMVPREPTIAMCIAGDGARHNVDDATRSPAVYRAMIAAAPPAAPQPEQFGWFYDITTGDEKRFGPIWQGGEKREHVEIVAADVGGKVFPLYAAPPAAPAVPLTDEQIDALWRAPMSADWEHREFARAIEKAHGIGGGNG